MSLDDIDQDVAEEMLGQVDESELQQQIVEGINQMMGPKLLEVKQRAQSGKTRQEVREEYKTMSHDEKTKKFMRAVSDLVAIAAELREDPEPALKRLKTRLRDPYTMEALLLIFDDPKVPDAWTEERKEFATTIVRWVALNHLPEMYTRREAEELMNKLYPEKDPAEVLGEPSRGQSRGPGDAPGQ